MHQAHGKNRMSAEIEEILLRTDRANPKHALPDSSELQLQRILRFTLSVANSRSIDSHDRLAPIVGSGSAFLSTLPLGVSGMACSMHK